MVTKEEKDAISDALSIQHGGTHYKNMAIQPVVFITKNKLNFLEGNVVKRICRHRNKNGVQDLLKAKHEIDLLIQLEYGDQNENDGRVHSKVDGRGRQSGSHPRRLEQLVRH